MNSLNGAGEEGEALSIVDKIHQRSNREGWTTSDLYAGFLQSSLLSYRSSQSNNVDQERMLPPWNQCAPEDYAHNCPWNDWTPPSKSRHLFQAAQAKRRAEPAEQRVRVHVCLSPDSKAKGDNTMVAFASVEVRADGSKIFLLHRGSEILAHLPLASIRISQDPTSSQIFLVSTVTPSSVSVFLYLEDAQRVHAFLALM